MWHELRNVDTWFVFVLLMSINPRSPIILSLKY